MKPDRVTKLSRTELLRRLLFALLASFCVLAVCSKSSFLYPMNDWVDVHCFFTVGRGILHGLVPYRDLYEQKGPLIYFLFALAGQISESSFLGVFVLEGLCFSWFVYLGGRIAELFSQRKWAFWPSAALLALLVPITPAFSHGSSAEEFFLPVLALGLFTVLKAMRSKTPLTAWQGFVLGLCSAAALWTKYTFCGLFAGLGAAVLIWYLFTGKARKLPGLILYFLLGCLALSGAVTGWFGFKNALPDLWQAYFVNNLSQYSHNIKSAPYDAPLPNLLNNLPWSIPMALGALWLAVRPKKRGWEALAVLAGAVCLFVFTYWNGRRYPYYALVMAVFAPFGLAAAASAACWLLKNASSRVTSALSAALGCALILAGTFIAYCSSPNTYLMKLSREEMPQYRFAAVIQQSEDRSLLNYGFLDGGFYFAAGVQPSDPFFCTLNIDLPEMTQSAQDSIDQGKTAFVVTRSSKLKNAKNYILVDEAELYFERRTWKYYLYRRVS
ncbi:MAG: hypothetical protein K5663_10495 [Clostridiales bacterium]|nr:hypothetical protein [Clostridiales bacterium]